MSALAARRAGANDASIANSPLRTMPTSPQRFYASGRVPDRIIIVDPEGAAAGSTRRDGADPGAAHRAAVPEAQRRFPMSLHLELLNPEQLAAVTLPDRHALVLAGAGSGKTRVLTTRIAWLIKSERVGPGGVLAVTFTNKAAREMYTRLSAMLPLNPRGMWIGTFHGLANRMLRAHHREAGLPREFQILDVQDQLAALKRLLRALDADEDRFPARELQVFVNSNKEEGLRASDVPLVDERTRRCAEFFAAYDEQCRREGVVDFAELLLRSYELLARNELLREHYAARFRHVLVDEFQDTNRLQYRWLKLLAGPATCLFAVGDDDQSIYAFRGANVANMAEFEREYRIAGVIRLEQNYRSQGNILEAANALIAHNRKRLGKNLWTASGEGEPLSVFEAGSDTDEARFIAEEVAARRHAGARLAAIAVLYRSNAQSRVIEHALFGAQIPYRVYGGLRFFERAEIKHALAYLRLVAAPEDDNALLRVANFPPRGIGARTLEQLQDAARARGASLWAAMEGLPGRAGQSLAGFRALIEALRAETRGLALAEQVEHVIGRSGLLEHYKAEREGADRVENLGELVNAAAAFDAEERASGLETGAGDAEPATVDPLTAFLTHAALEAGEHQAAEGQDALQLMTVHSAKGLEFDTVFLSGLEEGLFPHEQSLAERDGLEEERRLAYVAITRARQRLYLSYGQTRMLHGHTRYNLPSRFLDELPAGRMKWLTPRFARQRDFAWAARPKREARAFGAPREAAGFRIGQNVRHPKFGAGVIVDAEGRGADARVQVNFGAQGVKWLAVAVAKLQAA
jgi:DNA helicase-2/ATP-dependent DNA helicase PcrA